MTKLTQLQNDVFKMAVRKMEKETWFKGVCMDSFKWMNDKKIEEIGFENAVEELVCDTMSWDAW